MHSGVGPREVIREVPYEVVREVTKEVPIEIVREVHDMPYWHGGGGGRGGYGGGGYGGGGYGGSYGHGERRSGSGDEYDRIIEDRKERRARDNSRGDSRDNRGRSALDQRRAEPSGRDGMKSSSGYQVYGSKDKKGGSSGGGGMLRGKAWDDKSPTNSRGMLTGRRSPEM